MAKQRKYKVGQIVEFVFAGGLLEGTITKVDKDDRISITDKQGYKYPVSITNISKIVK